MARAIITAAEKPASQTATRGVPDGDAPRSVEPDGYADKLVKLIPAEVISLYLSMTLILSNSSDEVHAIVPAIVYGFCAFATWFYMRYTLKVTDWRQQLVTVAAFLIWGFTFSEPFGELSWWTDTYSGLLLAGFTFLAPNLPMGTRAQNQILD